MNFQFICCYKQDCCRHPDTYTFANCKLEEGLGRNCWVIEYTHLKFWSKVPNLIRSFHSGHFQQCRKVSFPTSLLIKDGIKSLKTNFCPFLSNTCNLWRFLYQVFELFSFFSGVLHAHIIQNKIFLGFFFLRKTPCLYSSLGVLCQRQLFLLSYFCIYHLCL